MFSNHTEATKTVSRLHILSRAEEQDSSLALFSLQGHHEQHHQPAAPTSAKLNASPNSKKDWGMTRSPTAKDMLAHKRGDGEEAPAIAKDSHVLMLPTMQSPTSQDLSHHSARESPRNAKHTLADERGEREDKQKSDGQCACNVM